jgi:hypothetical protein
MKALKSKGPNQTIKSARGGHDCDKEDGHTHSVKYLVGSTDASSLTLLEGKIMFVSSKPARRASGGYQQGFPTALPRYLRVKVRKDGPVKLRHVRLITRTWTTTFREPQQRSFFRFTHFPNAWSAFGKADILISCLERTIDRRNSRSNLGIFPRKSSSHLQTHLWVTYSVYISNPYSLW